MSYHGPIGPTPSRHGYQPSLQPDPPGGPGKRRWSRRTRMTLWALSGVVAAAALLVAVL